MGGQKERKSRKSPLRLLVEACESGDVAAAEQLIKEDEDGLIIFRAMKSVTPLKAAFTNKHHSLVKLLVERGALKPCPDKSIRRIQFNPLHEAVRAGDIDMVKLLLGGGADPNENFRGTDMHGGPPLCFLSEKETDEESLKCNGVLVELLLQAGADPKGRSKCARGALSAILSSYKGTTSMMPLIQDLVNRWKMQIHAVDIIEAADVKDFEVLEFLIQKAREDVLSSHAGYYALTAAITAKNGKLLRALVKRGLDLYASRVCGTPAFDVFASGDASLIDALFKSGQFRANAVDFLKRTQLHVVAQYGNVKLAKKLIKMGVSVTSATEYGETPLMFACQVLSPELVETLLKAGAPTNVKDEISDTELHWVLQGVAGKEVNRNFVSRSLRPDEYFSSPEEAAEKIDKAKQIISSLVSNGADIEAKGCSHQTLFFMAADSHLFAIADEVVAKYGADVRTTGQLDMSLLHW